MAGLQHKDWAALLLATLTALTAASVSAQTAAPSFSPPFTPPPFTPLPPADAAQLLTRIQQAARTLDYCGVSTHQQGDHLQAARIIHVLDATGERERIELLDGAPREWLRHNDVVERLMPDEQTVLREPRRGTRFPALLASDATSLSGLFDHYQIQQSADTRRLAGRPCHPVAIAPRDARRYGYRLCVDTQTGLLLQRQTVALDGTVVEQTAFTTLQFGLDVDMGLLPTPWPKSQWPVYQPDLKPASLAARGWGLRVPPGFVETASFTRRGWGRRADGAEGQHANTDNTAADAPDASNHDIVQLLLSDGLATISVFIEPAAASDAQPHLHPSVHLQGARQHGAINAYGARVAGHWLMGLGEVPMTTLKALVESAQYSPAAGAQ